MEPNDLVTTSGLAERTPFKAQTWRLYRLKGTGPVFIKVGGPQGRCLYRWSDVEAWLEARKHQNTSELRATSPAHRGRKPARRS